jgi:hypothetical protein
MGLIHRLRICRCGAIVTLILASAASPRLAAQPEAGADGKRLFYIGLALYSEPWSENDVVELADKLRTASGFRVVPMVASNVTSRPRRYPLADDATIAAMVRTAAEQAGADDLVFVDISTHGSPHLLARKAGQDPPTTLASPELARKLAPLAGRRTVIVISACYSGSLISDLRAPTRVIITAARADRSSFGCAPDARHTVFGQAELHAFGQPNRSLHQIFAAIRNDVARVEQARQYTPSEPQVSVGPEAANLYEAPLF